MYRFILLENSFQEYAKRYNVTISVCVMKGFKKGDIQNSYIFISSNFNVFLQTGYQKRFTFISKYKYTIEIVHRKEKIYFFSSPKLLLTRN